MNRSQIKQLGDQAMQDLQAGLLGGSIATHPASRFHQSETLLRIDEMKRGGVASEKILEWVIGRMESCLKPSPVVEDDSDLPQS